MTGYEPDKGTWACAGPIESRIVSFADFEAAWADPNAQAKELDVIKLNK